MQGGSRRREVGEAATSAAFYKATESVVPGDPGGIFRELTRKP